MDTWSHPFSCTGGVGEERFRPEPVVTTCAAWSLRANLAARYALALGSRGCHPVLREACENSLSAKRGNFRAESARALQRAGGGGVGEGDEGAARSDPMTADKNPSHPCWVQFRIVSASECAFGDHREHPGSRSPGSGRHAEGRLGSSVPTNG